VRGVKCRHYETPPRIAHQWNPLSVSVCGPDRDPGAMGVQRYTNDGMSLGTLIAPGTGGLADARGVTVGAGGDIFGADFSNSDILRFNANGGFLGTFASGVNVDTPLGSPSGQWGSVCGERGADVKYCAREWGDGGGNEPELYVGQCAGIRRAAVSDVRPGLGGDGHCGALFRFDAVTGVATFGAALDNPVGVAFDAAGDLFVGQRISDHALKFPALGGGSPIVIPNGTFASSPSD
jgi:hypothetical protein